MSANQYDSSLLQAPNSHVAHPRFCFAAVGHRVLGHKGFDAGRQHDLLSRRGLGPRNLSVNMQRANVPSQSRL